MVFIRQSKSKLFYTIVSLVSFIVINITFLSLSTSVSEVQITSSNPNHTYLTQQLFKKRLASYNLRYNASLPICKKTSILTNNEKEDFRKMSDLLQAFRKKIVSYPFGSFNGRGIVLTAGKDQIRFARVNLKMIELTRTQLPVQIWYSSSQIPHERMIDLLQTVPNLNASICCFVTSRCQTRTKVWQLNADHVYKPRTGYLWKPFPYKPAAILSSTFSEVLFLDCDAYVTRDPEELFLFDPMYLKFGALFFPDALKSRQKSVVWNLFNTSCAENEYEFDSATILVDKRKVWEGLYLAKLMNDDHELFYKYVTDGDKDTFRLAFRYMQVKYYLVMTPCSSGTYNGSHFCGHTLCKTDSLSQHIYVNHAHLFKYDNIEYSSANLGYTRIGLGDPNNNSFYFHHCQLSQASISCFHILKDQIQHHTVNNCYDGSIPSNEIENHEYKWDEPLTTEKSNNNRVLLSKTDNLMPHFVDNFLQMATNELR